jgi:hypothetical protein
MLTIATMTIESNKSRVRLTVDAIAVRIDAASTEDVEAILEELREDPDAGLSVLDELSRFQDPMIAAWAGWAAARVAGEKATPLLLELARHPDADVSDSAIDDLLTVDAPAVKRLLPVLRKKLRSADFWEPVAAMWTLAKIGATERLDDIRVVRDSEPVEWPQRTATVVCWLLEGDADEILRRIESHDHDLMGALAHAAAMIGSPEAWRVLEDCAVTAPDEDCRHFCSEALERAASRPHS